MREQSLRLESCLHGSHLEDDGFGKEAEKVKGETKEGGGKWRLRAAPTKPIRDCCRDEWTWDRNARSHEVRLITDRHARFHPNWSNGTAAVRGSTALNRGSHYWEVHVSHRVFGTSMMFGVATRRARLHANSFLNLLGQDEQSWGLSHKGVLWHAGESRTFTQAFVENRPTVIGVLFDSHKRTLSYYKDRRFLGVAFQGLDIQEELFPIVSSTAAKTEMTLGLQLRSFDSLQDRCRDVIAQFSRNNQLDRLPLPVPLLRYIKEVTQPETNGKLSKADQTMSSRSNSSIARCPSCACK